MRSYCFPTEAVTSTYLTRASWHLDRTYFSAVLLEVSAIAHSPEAQKSPCSELGTPPQDVDPELLHSPLQRRSLDPQTGGGTLRSGDDPVRLLERGNNPLSLGLIERGALVATQASLKWVRATRHREIFAGDRQNRAWRENRGAFQHVLQFADIPRPWIPDKRVHRFRRDHVDVFTETAAELSHVVANQQRNILGALAQRGYADRKHVEAVIEVGAEFVLPDHLFEITVRRRDQSGIAVQRASRPETLKLVLLQHAEQLRLQFERQLADFVQEYRPLVGEFETAHAARNRTGESTPLVSEQFAFEQGARNRRAIDLHEGV